MDFHSSHDDRPPDLVRPGGSRLHDRHPDLSAQDVARPLPCGPGPVVEQVLFGLLAALIAATPLGLLAAGTAWGEWDAEELADTDFFGSALGYTPSGMEQGFSFDALMPDYAIAGLPDAAGYIISAIVGTALLIIIFKVIASFLPSRPTFDTPAQH